MAKETDTKQDRSLVEAELVSSVAWLIRLRWFAGAGVLLATLLVWRLSPLAIPEGPLFAIGLGILAYNLIFYLQERRLSRSSAPAAAFDQLAKWQVGLDWLAMILLVHFSGGIESPVLWFFIFHIVIASIFFPPRTAYLFALLATGLMGGLALMEYFEILAHYQIFSISGAAVYDSAVYLAAVLLAFASTSLITAYLVSSIHERLRQREREIVELTRDLQRATGRLQALNEGARTVGSTLQLPQVLNRLVEATARAMDVRACSIRLLDAGNRWLEPVAAYGLSQAYLTKGPVDAENNALAREVLSGKVVNIPDAPQSPLIQYPEEARQEGVRSMLSAPLIGKEGPLGILRAYAVEANHFNAEDEDFLAAIAAQGSIAIENALAYQAIEQLDATKSQFIQMVTHELRSPVSVTQSLLRTLVGGYAGSVSEQQKDILSRAVRRVEFLQTLIDDLLDLAAGKADVEANRLREPVDLRATLDRVIKRFSLSAQEKGIDLQLVDHGPPQDCIVMATAEGLDRIFDNLVANAIKYTPSGGRVTVLLSQPDQMFQVAVEDTGIGIPDSAVQHLFEEFFRAPNAKAFQQEGTGLGLAIVKDLVTRFSGRVALKSTVDVGSCFTVTLPVAQIELAPQAAEHQPEVSGK